MTLSITYLLLLIVVGIVLPLNGIISGKQLTKYLSDNPGSKMMFFKQTIVLQIVIVILIFAAIAFNQDSINEIGLSFLRQPLQVLVLLSICFIGWWLFWVYRFDKQKLKLEIERDAEVKFLLPSSNQEYRWSIGTSFVVGISEEIVFRGFLYWQLNLLLPIVPAIIITNLLFGLCHYGTGFKNAFITFGLGLLLSIIFLFTESLLVLIAIHVLTDVYSMTKGKRYFDQNPEESQFGLKT